MTKQITILYLFIALLVFSTLWNFGGSTIVMGYETYGPVEQTKEPQAMKVLDGAFNDILDSRDDDDDNDDDDDEGKEKENSNRNSNLIIRKLCKDEIHKQTDEIMRKVSIENFLKLMYRHDESCINLTKHLIEETKNKYECDEEIKEINLRLPSNTNAEDSEEKEINGLLFIIPNNKPSNNNIYTEGMELNEIATSISFQLNKCEIIKDFNVGGIYINNLNYNENDQHAWAIRNVLYYNEMNNNHNIGGVQSLLFEILPSQSVDVFIRFSNCLFANDSYNLLIQKNVQLDRIKHIMTTLTEWQLIDNAANVNTRNSNKIVNYKQSPSWIMTAELSFEINNNI